MYVFEYLKILKETFCWDYSYKYYFKFWQFLIEPQKMLLVEEKV